MKRVMFMLAMAAMMATSSGCFHWFNKGGSCSQCGPAPATYAPPATCGSPYGMTAPSVSPTYDGQFMPGPISQ